tara:strand:- start:8561 stop:9265 length:705 start_codon:yes stop_codon:yes gene_type:complete
MPNDFDSSRGVLVLSPPRSGSSCVTACISFQGFSVGKTPTTVKDTYNEKGYFENQKILSFNVRVLRALTGRDDIHRSTDLSSAAHEKIRRHTNELKDLLRSEFTIGEAEAVPFVIKDPRILLLRAIYFPLLPDVKVICLARDRAACVSSMARMGKNNPSRAETQYGGTWDNYVDLLNGIEGVFPFMRVRFEEFIAKPEKSLEEICSFLDVPFTAEGRQAAIDFVDRRLVRYGDI